MNNSVEENRVPRDSHSGSKKGDQLIVGEIPYLNMLPIFTALKKHFDNRGIHFQIGHPAELNRMIRGGSVDISPSSSIEYGKNHEGYLIVPDMSISSLRKVKSVLLFSPFDLERENGFTVFATSRSETSVFLLKIILKEFLGKDAKVERAAKPRDRGREGNSPYLLIGDEAIIESLSDKVGETHRVYDLGLMWHTHTGLPFVFALWIVNSASFERNKLKVKKFCRVLLDAKKISINMIKFRNERMLGVDRLPWGFLTDYWSNLSYDLEMELKGLEMFFNLSRESGLLGNVPPIKFVDLP